MTFKPSPAQASYVMNPADMPVPVQITNAEGVTFEVNEADLANVGAKADTPATDDTGSFSLIALIKRGLQNWTSLLARLPASLGIKTAAESLSVAPASDANVARETYSTVTILSASTPEAGGATFTVFGAQACTALDIVNATNYDIEYQRGGAGATMVIPSYTSRLVQGITNANQIGIRRVDQVATAVTVKAEAFAV